MTISIEKNIKYCPHCGGRLEKRYLEGKRRYYCPSCDRVIYQNPVPVVLAVAYNNKGEILLVKRRVEPEKGKWSLVAGFLEMDESPEKGVLRELREEAGLAGKLEKLLNVYSQDSKRYGSIIAIAYIVKVDGTPTPGDDAEDARFFKTEDIPYLPFESHRKALMDGLKEIMKNRTP